MQNDGTPMPHLLAGYIGSNDRHMCTGTCSESINNSVAKLQYYFLYKNMIIQIKINIKHNQYFKSYIAL